MEDIKILLGDAADNFTNEQIEICLKHAKAEVKSYCNRDLDDELEICAQKIAIIKLNRLNTEGLTNQSYSGVSENYINGYPADILAVLNRKRKIKVV
jgi:hypothetical protein